MRLTWFFVFMIMIITVSFQLSLVDGSVKYHMSVDLSKYSRQNPSQVQKWNNCMCSLYLGPLTL